jgi:hypothetical protein
MFELLLLAVAAYLLGTLAAFLAIRLSGAR